MPSTQEYEDQHPGHDFYQPSQHNHHLLSPVPERASAIAIGNGSQAVNAYPQKHRKRYDHILSDDYRS